VRKGMSAIVLWCLARGSEGTASRNSLRSSWMRMKEGKKESEREDMKDRWGGEEATEMVVEEKEGKERRK
jgi:hypothetical protein